jgi:peptide/nickel transport system permease protein
MNNAAQTTKPLSEFQLAMRNFKGNRPAMLALIVLTTLYLTAIFADFLSPYSFSNEEREYSYCPPTPIQFAEEGRLTRPYVYGMKTWFNEHHRRIYELDKEQKYPLRLLVKGDAYKFLGVIPTDRHLWGVDAPGRVHLLGADSRGRDLFSRLLYGGRVSLSIGLLGVMIAFPIGLLVGGIAGYSGGKVDDILMRICEMIMMSPGFYILLALRAVVPADFNSIQVYFSIIFIMSFIGWAGLARVIRGMCLSLKQREFVLAAKAMGLSDLAIIVKHILPHTISYSIIAIMLSIPGYILGESALSLIGLGIVDPYASWGNMLVDAMSIVKVNFAPWLLLPGFFIFITVICFNVIGDALRDCLDPMYKSGK